MRHLGLLCSGRDPRPQALTFIVAPEPSSWTPDRYDRKYPSSWLVAVSAASRRVAAIGRADRRIRGRFLARRLLGVRSSRRLPDGTTVVYAPTLAAENIFEHARRLGATCVLVEDLPDLDGLNRDLDAAAQRHPDAKFLSRHRATPADIAVQRGERDLADRIIVFSHFGLNRYSRGVADLIGTIEQPRPAPIRRPPRLLLAGPATARNGLFEALDVLDRIPDASLFIRPSEGMEPRDALSRPRVQVANGGPVDAVLALAWCETFAAETKRAAESGLPIIGTARAAGPVRLTAEVAPGDINAIVDAIEELPYQD